MKQRYSHSDDFPVHFEGGGIRVYTNSSNEVFVENISSGVLLRICTHGKDIRALCSKGLMMPCTLNGVRGMDVIAGKITAD